MRIAVMLVPALLWGCASKPEQRGAAAPQMTTSVERKAEQKFSDRLGQFVISPQFDFAAPFREGLAAVRIGDKKTGRWGFIDKQGKMVIALQSSWHSAYHFSDGLAHVELRGDKRRWGYVNKLGELVFESRFDSSDSFEDGLAKVRVGTASTGKRGYIDKQGKLAIPPQFDAAESFSEGIAAVRIGDATTGKWGYIDKQGAMVVPPRFDIAYEFSEGLAAVFIGDRKTSKGKWGFVDKRGSLVISPQFDDAYGFSEGLARVRMGDDDTGKWGFIDKQGIMVIAPRFNSAYEFSDGRAAVRFAEGEVDKWGYIDKQGRLVINSHVDKSGKVLAEPWFVLTGLFSEGLASARAPDRDGKNGFIDVHGNWVIQPQFDDYKKFLDGLAPVYVGTPESGKWGYISR